MYPTAETYAGYSDGAEGGAFVYRTQYFTAAAQGVTAQNALHLNGFGTPFLDSCGISET
jgi:hypothetical protein